MLACRRPNALRYLFGHDGERAPPRSFSRVVAKIETPHNTMQHAIKAICPRKTARKERDTRREKNKQNAWRPRRSTASVSIARYRSSNLSSSRARLHRARRRSMRWLRRFAADRQRALEFRMPCRNRPAGPAFPDRKTGLRSAKTDETLILRPILNGLHCKLDLPWKTRGRPRLEATRRSCR